MQVKTLHFDLTRTSIKMLIHVALFYGKTEWYIGCV